MFEFVSSAYAQAPGGGAPQGAVWHQFILLGLMLVIFYLLLIRPQQKRMKEHQTLISGLERGDEVVLQGGVHGKVVGLTDAVVTLEVADGVRIKADRQSVTRRKQSDA